MRTTINYIGVQNDDDEYGQHEEERMAIVPNLTTESPPMRPTRPYSYYVATNFHPFDLSILSQQLEEQQQENLKQQQQQHLNEQQKQNKQEIHVSRKQQRQNNKKSGKKTKQRLSVSLVDIKNPNVSVNTDGNTQEIIVNDDDSISRLKREKKAKSNQNVNEPTTPSSTLSFFKRSSHLTATMPASTSRAHKAAIIASNQSTTQANSQPITGKINKFFRQLFRVGAEGKHHHTTAPSTIDEEEEVII